MTQHRKWRRGLREEHHRPGYPLQHVREILRTHDRVIGNENAVADAVKVDCFAAIGLNHFRFAKNLDLLVADLFEIVNLPCLLAIDQQFGGFADNDQAELVPLAKRTIGQDERIAPGRDRRLRALAAELTGFGRWSRP